MMKLGASLKTLPNDSSALCKIEPIPTSRVSAFFGKADEGCCETWRAALVGSPYHAWVKFDDDPRRIIAELVCSQVGRALGLPIPRPHLVCLQPEDIPKESTWHGIDAPRWCFASQHAGKRPKSFARHLRSEDPVFKRALSSWTGFYAAMVFDEWIANDDRNPGNLLFDPVDQSFWMIDHGNGLTGAYWPIWGLKDADIVMGNVLADELVAAATPKVTEAMRIEHTANAQMRDAANILWSEVGTEEYISKLAQGVKPEEVRGFLTDRIQHTARLLMARLGYPQLELSYGDHTRPVDASIH